MKTRTAIADICHAFSPKYYNKKEKKWCVNPNGTHNSCLYIGTEMELIDEIEPILWAYLADVPQDHIEFNLYEDDEEERVREAIRILEEESFIYLCYCPSYDIDTLTEIIEEHKLKYNITSVFFDYIQPTSELMAEYARTVKLHMTVREDQVLVNLSKKLKDICRTYNISFDTATQVSGDFKNIENRDVTIVRGAKSLVDKADIGMIAMPPTDKELKLVEGIIQKRGKVGSAPLPNLIYSIYKNRGGRFNKCKIWLYIDYSTMRTHDMFVTDYSYKLWKDFPKVYINTSGEEGKVAYDFGATIFAEDIDKVNEDIEQIKKDIELEDYTLPSEEELEEEVKEQENNNNSNANVYTDNNGVGYVKTEENFDDWEF